jgi:hypothetical protein
MVDTKAGDVEKTPVFVQIQVNVFRWLANLCTLFYLFCYQVLLIVVASVKCASATSKTPE